MQEVSCRNPRENTWKESVMRGDLFCYLTWYGICLFACVVLKSRPLLGKD